MAKESGRAFTVKVLDADTVIQLTVIDNGRLQLVSVRQRPNGTPISGNYNPSWTRVNYPKPKFDALLQAVRPGYADYAKAEAAGQVVHVTLVYDDQGRCPVTDFAWERPVSVRAYSAAMLHSRAASPPGGV